MACLVVRAMSLTRDEARNSVVIGRRGMRKLIEKASSASCTLRSVRIIVPKETGFISESNELDVFLKDLGNGTKWTLKAPNTRIQTVQCTFVKSSEEDFAEDLPVL